MAESRTKDFNAIREFLLSRGWRSVRAGERFERFKPPADLRLGENFWVSLPSGSVAQSAASTYLSKVNEVLSQIYGWSPDNLDRALGSHATVLSIRLADDLATREGALPLPDFDDLISRMRSLIADCAEFVVSDLPFVGRDVEPAEAFVNSCLMLQTEKGSFVARIELPSDLTLKSGDLLGKPITGRDAAERMASVLAFVNERVLEGDTKIYEDEFLATSNTLVNVDVLGDIEQMLSRLGQREVTFSFLRSDYERTIGVGAVGNEKLEQLSRYVTFVKEKLADQIALNVTGRVVELRSRDPDSDRNYVTVMSLDRADHMPFVLALDKERYVLALEAHREKRPVRVRGLGIKLKTQIKVIDLQEFGWLGQQ